MSPEDAHMWAETVPLGSAQALGRAVRRRRHNLYLSQTKLSGIADVPRSAISRLELEGDESIPFGVVMRLAQALRLELELRPRGSKFTPRPPSKLNELGLSPNTMSALRKEDLEHVADLGPAMSMLSRTAFGSGVELYEIVCALNRYGLSLPTSHARGAPSDRERQIFRLRIIDGLMLSEIGQLYAVNVERVRQILMLFGLSGPPPAACLRRAERARGRRRRD